MFAKRIASTLEEIGLRCWIAPRDIPPGTEWAAAIPAGIEECAIFVFVLTEHSANDSKWVKLELLQAIASKKPIFVLQCDGVEPGPAIKFLLSDVQWFPLGRNFPDAYIRHLAGAVIARLSSASVVSPPVAMPVFPPKIGKETTVSRRWIIAISTIVGSITVLAVAARLAWLPDPETLYLKGRADLANGQAGRALAEWHKASSRGHREASIALGKELISGRYGDQGMQEGAALLGSLAKNGDTKAQEALDAEINPLIGSEDPHAVATLKPFVDANVPAAEYGMAVHLLNENRTNPAGIALLKRAAQAGVKEAMRELGRAYFQGKGVEEDNRQARDWIRRAAVLGDTIAQNSLARVEAYADADTKYEQDLPSANKGDIPARLRVASYFIQIKGDATQGFNMIQATVAMDSPDPALAAEALNALAECYLNGIGVSEDRARAIELYKKAAELGSDIAKHNYDLLLKQDRKP